MKHERVVDPVPEEPVVEVPTPVVQYSAVYLGDRSVKQFSSQPAAQAHVDCWPGWVLT